MPKLGKAPSQGFPNLLLPWIDMCIDIKRHVFDSSYLRQNGKDPSDSGDPDLPGYPPLAANWLQPPQWQYGVHFPVPVTVLEIPVSPAHPFPRSHILATV